MATSRSPLEKRIRRRISGRPQTFFAATAPGFEGLCRDELAGLGISDDHMTRTGGGVVFTARLHEAFRANLYLRTANRILMRISRFRASGFAVLEKQLNTIEWELYLRDGPEPDVRVSTRHSRLYHKKAIAQRLLESIARRRRSTPFTAPGGDAAAVVQQVYVRIVDDRVELSVDSSGAHLYQRGIKSHGGPAPLRETIAAAVLQIAGHDPQLHLVDPMCGTGTFSLEAAMVAANIPAGWFRRFAFEQWPGFASQRWTHIRRTARDAFTPLRHPSVFASDIDPTACHRLYRALRGHGLADSIAVACRDFFQWAPPAPLRPGLVVINPPYGRRLGNRPSGRRIHARTVQHLVRHYSGWRYALLCPFADVPMPDALTVNRRWIRHGGLALMLLHGRIH